MKREYTVGARLLALVMLSAVAPACGDFGDSRQVGELPREENVEATQRLFVPVFANGAMPANSYDGWTGVSVQNLGGKTATVTVQAYTEAGISLATQTLTIAARAAVALTAPSFMPNGTWAHLEISTTDDVPLAAIVNVRDDDDDNNHAGASYEAVGQPDTRIDVPMLRMDDGMISIQNTSDESNEVTLVYADGSVRRYNLAGHGSRHVFATDSGADETYAASAQEDVGGVRVYAEHPVAVSVLGRPEGSLWAYTGLRPGATELPIVNFNLAYDIKSTIYVSNGNPVNDTLSVTYRSAVDDTTCVETISGVGPLGVADFGWSFTNRPVNSGYERTTTCNPGRMTGAATLSPGSTGVVIQESGGLYSAYSAFNTFEATEFISFPLVKDRRYGGTSGISLYNPGPGTAEIECLFSKSKGDDGGNETHKWTLAPNKALNFYAGGELGESWLGAAQCSTTTGKILGVLSEREEGVMIKRSRGLAVGAQNPFYCDALEAMVAGNDIARTGFVMGVEGYGQFITPVETFGGVDITMDAYHHQIAASRYWGSGFVTELGAQTGYTGYAGIATNFQSGVADWYGAWEQAGVDVGLDVPGLEAAVGVEFFTGIPGDDGLLGEWAWPNGEGVMGGAVRASGGFELELDLPGPEVTADLAKGTVWPWEWGTQQIHDLLDDAGLQVRLVHSKTGEACPADWRAVEETTCVVEIGDDDDLHTFRAAQMIAAIHLLYTGAPAPLTSVASAQTLASAAFQDAGESFTALCPDL